MARFSLTRRRSYDIASGRSEVTDRRIVVDKALHAALVAHRYGDEVTANTVAKQIGLALTRGDDLPSRVCAAYAHLLKARGTADVACALTLLADFGVKVLADAPVGEARPTLHRMDEAKVVNTLANAHPRHRMRDVLGESAELAAELMKPIAQGGR